MALAPPELVAEGILGAVRSGRSRDSGLGHRGPGHGRGTGRAWPAVDKRFNRSRYDAEVAVSACAVRVGEQV